MPEEITQFDLPKNSYAAFDAQSMRDLIIDRLNNNSATTFTDQNYEGSNLNAIIDVIAYSFHTLLFYLNQTSSESMFSDSQLYENMNRIVKLIDYKPIGRQSSIVPMILKSTESLSTGYFTLPKFSFVTSNGITYSTTKDITFRKVNSGAIETLTPIDNTLFFEGKYKEYEKNIIADNAKDYLDHLEQYLLEAINTSNTQYVSEKGEVERWKGGVNKDEFLEKMKTNFTEFRKQVDEYKNNNTDDKA